MWIPPERVRHELPVLRAPSAEEAVKSRLFSPLALASGLVLRERTWVPAMVPWRATEEGFVTPEVLEWYGRFADGEPGVIVVEATGIRDVPSGPLLRIGHDRFLPGLAELARTVHRRSRGRTRILIQIIDFLRIKRRPPREKFLGAFLEITGAHRARLADRLADPAWIGASEADVRRRLVELDDDALDAILDRRELESLRWGFRERVTDLHLPHVRDLPRTLPPLFAAAALRAKQAGFDGVELHFAHAYTMASFLSRLNTRDDGYGGSLENRVKLPLEVFAAARASVGEDFTLGCRFLCDEIIEGGSRVDDASFFGVEFARAGMDFLSLSTGGKFEDSKQPKVGEAAYPYTGPSGHECMPSALSDARGPFGRQVDKQARVRAAVRAAGFSTPTVAAGGIDTFDLAEGILARGEADLIGAARQTLADPDWFLKLRLGKGAEIRRCVYSNYCEGLDQKHKQVTCKLWDREDLDEPSLQKSNDGRRRLLAPAWVTRPSDGYFALLLSPASSERLAAAYATLANPIAHHCTVRHGTRDPADLLPPFTAADLGSPFRLKVRGLARSARVEAVVVSLVLPDGRVIDEGFSANRVPHVTVATDGASEPFLANALLEAGFEAIDGPVLDATLAHSDAWKTG
jgi:2,4-dienoyl-CoA reductase-like NADH-dependent reductase (Old Yellow Enzyme family)